MFARLFPVVAAMFVFSASVVHAQYPACAQACLGQADPGSCSLDDTVCLCNNAAYTNPTNDCFSTSCSHADWTTAYNYAVQACNNVGVTTNNIVNPPAKRSFSPVYCGRRSPA